MVTLYRKKKKLNGWHNPPDSHRESVHMNIGMDIEKERFGMDIEKERLYIEID